MANTARKVASALAVSATLLTASVAAAADTERRKIVLHVDDHAGLSPVVLREAEREIVRIYDAAGVDAVWTAEGIPLPATDGALHVKVLILDERMSERKIAADRVPAGVLGQAARATRRAYVFAPRVWRIANGYQVAPGALLGRVIAHEVGHLVLPERSHAKAGIMRADLDLRASADDRFTVEQVAMMQRELAAN